MVNNQPEYDKVVLTYQDKTYESKNIAIDIIYEINVKLRLSLSFRDWAHD